jgi:hypothetical protein
VRLRHRSISRNLAWLRRPAGRVPHEGGPVILGAVNARTEAIVRLRLRAVEIPRLPYGRHSMVAMRLVRTAARTVISWAIIPGIVIPGAHIAVVDIS